MLTLGTGVGGGLILGGKPYRGAIGAGAELGHVVIVHDGRPCPAAATATSRPTPPGTRPRLATRGVRGGDRRAQARPARQRGRPEAKEILADIGAHLGSGLGSLVNIFNPELIVVGGGFAAAGTSLRPEREVHARARRCRRAKRSGSCAPSSEPRRLDRRRVRRDRGARRGELMPLAVCATPIGNLEDVTLRVLRELPRPTSSSARTRAARGPSSPATGSRRTCSATTSTTRPSARLSSFPGSRRASGSRSSPTQACPASPTRARR